MTGQGIGARVLRKEDGRFLHGRGNYVSDMILPGQSEVASTEQNLLMAARYDQKNPVGLKRLLAQGVQLRQFPRPVMDACYKAGFKRVGFVPPPDLASTGG